MTVATGFRPRRWEQHLRLATTLSRAPARLGIEHADDGWLAAHLAVCGRQPIWASRADPRPVERCLLRLGLPGLGQGRPDARITWDLNLRGRGRPQRVSLPAPRDVDIISSVSGGWQAARDHVRTLQGQGRLILIDRTRDPRVAALLERVPRATVLRRPGIADEEVLGEGLAVVQAPSVLWVPEGTLLLPGALIVLRHALHRERTPGLAVGDALVLDPSGAVPQGLDLVPRRAEHRGSEVLAGQGPLRHPVLFDARLVPELADRAAPCLRDLAHDHPVRVAPVWTAGLIGACPRAARAGQVPSGLVLVPRDGGQHVIVDDGDEGALGETLAGLPAGARTSVLRAVPDAADSAFEQGHQLLGGFGDLSHIDVEQAWNLRLCSDPAWVPPALHEPQKLLSYPGAPPSAVVALAAVSGWPLPRRVRPVGRDRLDPAARLACDARAALDRGDRRLAFTLGRALLAAAPGWQAIEDFLDRVERRQAG